MGVLLSYAHVASRRLSAIIWDFGSGRSGDLLISQKQNHPKQLCLKNLIIPAENYLNHYRSLPLHQYTFYSVRSISKRMWAIL